MKQAEDGRRDPEKGEDSKRERARGTAAFVIGPDALEVSALQQQKK